MEQLARKIIADGRVQGVGFRPSVCRIAADLGLQGYVRNLGGVVEILALGDKVDHLEQALKALPEPASITALACDTLSEKEFKALYNSVKPSELCAFFAIASEGKASQSVVPADIAICPSCAKELQDHHNRRYGYPYISCAQCGPRYTIVEGLPYDRIKTTMHSYELCPECSKEYKNMQDRRGHGETISCNACGPQLYGYLRENNVRIAKAEAVAAAKALLEQGKIILVKSVGGYNLVCRADSEEAVANLRQLKSRPTKPLAVMCADLAMAAKLIRLDGAAKKSLESAVKPIVLLPKVDHCNKYVADNVAAGCARLGVFLPPMGLYVQLCEIGVPLVVTSCNYSGAPIIYKDEDALAFYANRTEVAGIFAYDREILRPADDSVVQGNMVLRRTRGYLPEPIYNDGLKSATKVLAVGAQMEPGFCLAADNKFYPCQVPGELEEEATEKLWLDTIQDWQGLLNIQPQLLVGDLHPLYNATELGQGIAKKPGLTFLQVQHHHAHALAVMAEHSLQGPVVAVCFDGTGLGTDGTIWGGEFLLCEEDSFKRIASLEPIPMLGGDESMKQAWKSMLCYLAHAEQQKACELETSVLLKFDQRYAIVKEALHAGMNTILNSSMGRLFDAAAVLLGLADYNSHQGRCAQLLENAACWALERNLEARAMSFKETHKDAAGEVRQEWSAGEILTNLLDVRLSLEADALTEEEKQELRASAALGFHQAIIAMVAATVKAAANQYGVRQIALAGGCFVNTILLEGVVNELQQAGLKVYYNEKVPPGDGGIALGQAYYGQLVSKKQCK